MRATDKLRRMLDERGVEWRPSGDYYCKNVITHWNTGSIHWTAFELECEENLCLNCTSTTDLTPAQAIEATLGPETCHDIGDRGDFRCSSCLVEWQDANNHNFRFCPSCGAKVVGE